MNKPKETFTVGTRVRHVTDEVCKEGVVVWKHANYAGVIDKLKGKVWWLGGVAAACTFIIVNFSRMKDFFH